MFCTTRRAYSACPVNLEKRYRAWRSRSRFAPIENGLTTTAISIRCGVSPDFMNCCGQLNEEADAANPICSYYGWSPTRLGRRGRGSRNNQSRELAYSPKV